MTMGRLFLIKTLFQNNVQDNNSHFKICFSSHHISYYCVYINISYKGGLVVSGMDFMNVNYYLFSQQLEISARRG